LDSKFQSSAAFCFLLYRQPSRLCRLDVRKASGFPGARQLKKLGSAQYSSTANAQRAALPPDVRKASGFPGKLQLRKIGLRPRDRSLPAKSSAIR